MIAADSSSLIAYIGGEDGADVELLHTALGAGEIALPPVVLAEILSEPRLPARQAALIKSLPLLDLKDGYWVRVAGIRSRLIVRKLKARLADAMIAQTCIDHEVALIARDADFRHYAEWGLMLA